MARQKRYVRDGEPVHATARGVNRTLIFRHGFDKRKYIKRFAAVAEQEGVEIHGYCILDNHVHWLLVPTRKEGIARVFLRVHTWWAQYFNKQCNRAGHLFQSRFEVERRSETKKLGTRPRSLQINCRKKRDHLD